MLKENFIARVVHLNGIPLLGRQYMYIVHDKKKINFQPKEQKKKKLFTLQFKHWWLLWIWISCMDENAGWVDYPTRYASVKHYFFDEMKSTIRLSFFFLFISKYSHSIRKRHRIKHFWRLMPATTPSPTNNLINLIFLWFIIIIYIHVNLNGTVPWL